MNFSDSKYKIFILLVILAVGLGLRLYSIGYGLPHIVAPDEKRQVLDALSMGARKSFVSLEYTYPAFHKYILAFCFGIYFIGGCIFRVFTNISDFVFYFLVNPRGIFLVARLISVGFGIALLVPVYLLGKNLFSKNVGIIAFVFSLFTFQLYAHSQWATADIMLAFLSTWSFYYIIRCHLFGKTKDFVLTSIFMGLALITKYQGAYIVVPFIVMLAVNCKSLITKANIYRTVLLSFCIIGAIAIVGNISFIFNFKDSFARLLELKDEIMGISSMQPFSNNIISVLLWFIKELVRQELILGFVFIVGLIYSAYKHSKGDIIFLSYILVCLFSLVNFGFRSLHLVVYTFAILSVFGARLVERIFQIAFKKGYNFSRALTIVLVIVIPSVINIASAGVKRSNPDTRIIAKDWIEENIPKGSKIAQDWYIFSVPLNSEFPVLFQDDKLKEYYVKYFDDSLRQRYEDFTSLKKKYTLMQIRYETDDLIWPVSMPIEARKRAEKIPLIGRLYRWFNFRSIKSLDQSGVDYVIISSYSYNHFLFDDDPRKKTGLFNPFIIEDTLSSNRQAKNYDENSKYGLLFYLSQRARNFYLPLLDSKDKKVKLIKEVLPTERNLGPVVHIYKLVKK